MKHLAIAVVILLNQPFLWCFDPNAFEDGEECEEFLDLLVKDGSICETHETTYAGRKVLNAICYKINSKCLIVSRYTQEGLKRYDLEICPEGRTCIYRKDSKAPWELEYWGRGKLSYHAPCRRFKKAQKN